MQGPFSGGCAPTAGLGLPWDLRQQEKSPRHVRQRTEQRNRREDNCRNARMGAMKTARFCVLSVLLSMAAHGGISDALSASGVPPPQTPASPSIAVTPPSPDTPAAGADSDAPADSPRNPDSTPMPAPARTDHYAGPAKNPSGRVSFQTCANAQRNREAGSYST